MKRYWLFVYSQYYPNGGMEDFRDSFDSIEGAREAALQEIVIKYYSTGYYWHIYDSVENIISIYSTDNVYPHRPVEIKNIQLKDINNIDLDI